MRSVKRHRTMNIASAAAVFLSSSLAPVVMPRTYPTEVKCSLKRNNVIPGLGNPGRAIPRDVVAPTRAASEVILRTDNLVALIKKTDLVDQWDVVGARSIVQNSPARMSLRSTTPGTTSSSCSQVRQAAGRTLADRDVTFDRGRIFWTRMSSSTTPPPREVYPRPPVTAYDSRSDVTLLMGGVTQQLWTYDPAGASVGVPASQTDGSHLTYASDDDVCFVWDASNLGNLWAFRDAP